MKSAPVSSELVRFFVIAVCGLVVDLSIATGLVVWGGFHDITAAATGLFCGMVFNYFLHLTWTFRNHDRRASVGHFLRFATGVLVTLAVRSGVLWGIEAAGWQTLLPAGGRLFIAAVAGFALSYAINRYLVFSATGKPGTDEA